MNEPHLDLHKNNVNFRSNAAEAIRNAFFSGVISKTAALIVWDCRVMALPQRKRMEAHGFEDRREMVAIERDTWRKVVAHYSHPSTQ